MGRAESRIAARRAVHEAQLERRREQATRDKELQALAVEVQVTLAGRPGEAARCRDRGRRHPRPDDHRTRGVDHGGGRLVLRRGHRP